MPSRPQAAPAPAAGRSACPAAPATTLRFSPLSCRQPCCSCRRSAASAITGPKTPPTPTSSPARRSSSRLAGVSCALETASSVSPPSIARCAQPVGEVRGHLVLLGTLQQDLAFLARRHSAGTLASGLGKRHQALLKRLRLLPAIAFGGH